MKILLVDDSKAMRKIQRDVIRQLGFIDIVEAENGADAIKKMAANNFQIDLILTDWNMPVMNGITFVREVKKRANLAEIPIIMVTSESEREQIEAAVSHGVDGYIHKPFTAELLRKTISAIKEGLRGLADAPITEQLTRIRTTGRDEKALFSQLSASVEERIKELADVKYFQAGQEIVPAGSVMEKFHFVLFGEVRALTPSGSPTGAIYRQGDCYAEMSLLTGDPLECSYASSTVATVGEIDGNDFMTVLMTMPEFSAVLSRYLATRALDARRKSESSTMLASQRSEMESSTWSGSLKIISLPELMQTLSIGRKSGKLYVEGPAGSGEIALTDGAAVAAHFPPEEGDEAFIQMMLADFSIFRLNADTVDVEQNINTETTGLILEALRRKDEFNAGR
ncbi:MAG: response regulator [Planctomycetota bacterium]